MGEEADKENKKKQPKSKHFLSRWLNEQKGVSCKEYEELAVGNRFNSGGKNRRNRWKIILNTYSNRWSIY